MNSLKDLKDALNKIEDDEILDSFYFTHGMWLEDADNEMGLFYQCDEEKQEKCGELLLTKPMNIISDFMNQVERDVRKVIIVTLDEDRADYYIEDAPSER